MAKIYVRTTENKNCTTNKNILGLNENAVVR